MLIYVGISCHLIFLGGEVAPFTTTTNKLHHAWLQLQLGNNETQKYSQCVVICYGENFLSEVWKETLIWLDFQFHKIQLSSRICMYVRMSVVGCMLRAAVQWWRCWCWIVGTLVFCFLWSPKPRMDYYKLPNEWEITWDYANVSGIWKSNEYMWATKK